MSSVVAVFNRYFSGHSVTRLLTGSIRMSHIVQDPRLSSYGCPKEISKKEEDPHFSIEVKVIGG